MKIRQRPTFTHSGNHRTFAEFVAFLRKSWPHLPEKKRGLLVGAAELARLVEGAATEDSTPISLPAIGTVLLATKIIAETDFLEVTPNNEKYEIYVDAARELATEAEGVQLDGYERSPSRQAVLLNWIWLLCSNHLHQGDFVHRVANLMILSGLAGFGGLLPEPDKVDGIFLRNEKISALDYVLSLIALEAHARRNPSFSTQVILSGSPREKELLPLLVRQIEGLSLPINEPLDSQRLAFAKSYSGKALAEAVFLRFPIFRIGPEHYLYCGRSFLTAQLTAKFLPKANAYARKEASGSSGETAFAEFVGARLDNFVGELCRTQWGNNHESHGEFKYQIGKEELLSSDRIVFEKFKGKEVAVLIELKAKLLTESSLTGSSWEKFEKDIASAYSKSIAQGMRFLYDAHHGAKAVTPEGDNLLDRLKCVDQIALLPITPDLPPLFSMKFMRDLLLENAFKRVGENVWKWFQDYYVNRWYWHIIDLPTFEIFLLIPERRRHLFYELRRYLRRSRIDYEQSFRDGVPHDFRNYLILNHGADDGDGERLSTSIEGLHLVYEVLYRQTLIRFFDKDPGPLPR